MHLEFKPFTESDFTKYASWAVDNYAHAIGQNMDVSAAEALEKSKKDFAHLLPKGHLSPDHALYTLLNPKNGKEVGIFWAGYAGAEETRRVFVYDIMIYEQYRGQGFGKAAMLGFETIAKAAGAKSIALNVFGYNTSARALYEKIGYGIKSLHMGKKL